MYGNIHRDEPKDQLLIEKRERKRQPRSGTRYVSKSESSKASLFQSEVAPATRGTQFWIHDKTRTVKIRKFVYKG